MQITNGIDIIKEINRKNESVVTCVPNIPPYERKLNFNDLNYAD